jgi:hypothetical protein
VPRVLSFDVNLEPTSAAPADRPVTLRAAALGLFVGWLLLFLPLSNVMQFFPRSRVEDRGDYVLECQLEGRTTSNRGLQGAYDSAGHVVDRWSEISGQFQFWKMFCPKFPSNSLFPIYRLELRDGTIVEVESRFQPDRLEPGLRPPLLNFRHHHVEVQAVIGLWHLPPETMESKPEEWRDDIKTWVDARPGTIRAVMRRAAIDSGKMNEIVSVTMALRFVAKPNSGEPTAPAIRELPFVRMTLATDALERYDAVLRSYVPVEAPRP